LLRVIDYSGDRGLKTVQSAECACLPVGRELGVKNGKIKTYGDTVRRGHGDAEINQIERKRVQVENNQTNEGRPDKPDRPEKPRNPSEG
jgi:hypothetical protein